MDQELAIVSADRVEPGYQTEYMAAQSTPEQMRDLRRRVMQFLSLSPFPEEELSCVEIALGEACTNALRHGSPKGALDEVRVKCMRNAHTLILEVSDNGRGFDPALVRPPAPGELREDGMGLLLMRGLTDSVEFEFEIGTTVRLVKHRRPG